jgi:FAD/FMN-containing dehydrogenase
MTARKRPTRSATAKTATAKPKPATPKRSAKTSSPRPPAAVDRLAQHLDQLQAQPTPDALAQVQADLQQQGLETFFRAMTRTPSAQRQQRARRAQAAASAPVAAVPSATIPTSSSTAVTAGDAATEKSLFGAPSGDVGLLRQTWLNCIGNLVVNPLRLYRPTTLAELRSVIQQAAAHRCKVRAVGSGHSFTDVATSPDFLIDTHGLNHTLALEQDVLRDSVATRALFETEGGILVRDLNEALWDAGLGLINMGGYDGQTLMGVVSTSTHGSGIAFGPLCSFAVSMTLVASGGRTVRIEPTDGITDPARWQVKHPDIELVQDDDTFYAAQVGIGCMGVVYSLILQVRERYWMKEERTLSTWTQVKQDLQAGKVLSENRHYEVLVNPYVTNGEHTCLVTRRNPQPEPTVPPEQLPRRNFLVEMFARFPGTGPLLVGLINSAPDLTPSIIDAAMQSLAVEYIDRSYRVFNIGAANDAPAYGSEIGFRLGTHIDAVERILEIAAQGQSVGKAYLTSPFSLRFVKASPAFMSMMYGDDTCMIEFPMLDNTIGGKELLRRIETEMYAFGGRPHWGLLNFLCGNDLLPAMYPQFERWLQVLRQFNSDGAFDNAFTDRCGISRRTFVRP